MTILLPVPGQAGTFDLGDGRRVHYVEDGPDRFGTDYRFGARIIHYLPGLRGGQRPVCWRGSCRRGCRFYGDCKHDR